MSSSGERYRPFDHQTFAEWMAEIGFVGIDIQGTWEYVWQRPVVTRNDRSNRYMVRIYSSVSQHDKMSRDVGGDAIRVLLFDTVRDRPVQSYRVYRTESAKQNTIKRAREAYGYALKPEHVCQCGSLFVLRTGKKGTFLGCSSYPECKETKPLKVA